jgi:MFS family permease
MLYTAGVIHFGFTAVFEPIAREFGWGYAQVSLAASLRGLEMGLLAPLMGLLVDRWGPRGLIFGGAVITGFGLILLSRTTSLGMFYGAFILISVGMSTSSHTVMMTAVSNWFRRKVATAIGIMVSGAALGGLLVPLIALLIDLFAWRRAMIILGLGTWVIVIPLSFLVRHRPEQYGYLPDGEASSTPLSNEGVRPAQMAELNIQPREALRSRPFWHVALAFWCYAFVISAVVTHVMPYLSSIGISRRVSSLVASAAPTASILGRLSFGWLGDRVDRRKLSVTGFALMGLGLLLFDLSAAGGAWVLVLFLVLFGTGWGGNVIMRAALLREYFGRERFGTIHGFLNGMMMLGNMAGAPVVGWAFDELGSYRGVWFVLAALPLVSVVTLATTPRVSNMIQPPDKAIG